MTTATRLLTAVELAPDTAAEAPARLGFTVHDASRLEWSLSLPLPTNAPLEYSFSVELRVPCNLFVRHPLWDQLQSFTRLDGPEIDSRGVATTVDVLRRAALAAVYRLARASEAFRRHCERAQAHGSVHRSWLEFEVSLTAWLDVAFAVTRGAREELCTARAGDASELRRERELVDEYLSVRLVDLLAGSERALRQVAESSAEGSALDSETLGRLEGCLACALSSEFEYRVGRGFTSAGGATPADLERYLERSSALKKHFQQVLFLERESYQIDDRAYHWIAALVAVVASTWAFAWQLALTNPAQRGTQVGSGIITLSLIAGLVYAAKDRIKEVGRSWMTRTVHRVYRAQRITRYRVAASGSPSRNVVVSARESFDHKTALEPDPLNPLSGATQPLVILAYGHSGKVLPNADLVASGAQRVKHVFRYDLSPMFARLDDAVKPVPVPDDAHSAVHFVNVRRYYRLPIRLQVRCGDQRLDERAILVMDKLGLERLERATSSWVAAEPAAEDAVYGSM